MFRLYFHLVILLITKLFFIGSLLPIYFCRLGCADGTFPIKVLRIMEALEQALALNMLFPFRLF